MKARYNEDTDVLHIWVGKQKAVRTEEIDKDVIISYDKRGHIVKIEVNQLTQSLIEGLSDV